MDDEGVEHRAPVKQPRTRKVDRNASNPVSCKLDEVEEHKSSDFSTSEETSSDEDDDPHLRLRTRKLVSYKEHKDTSNSDCQDETPPPPKRGRGRPPKKLQGKKWTEPPPKKAAFKKPQTEAFTLPEDSSDDDNDYEKLRQQNIRERMELVKSLGVTDLKTELKKPSRINTVKPRTSVLPAREKSKRLVAIIESKEAQERAQEELRKLGEPSSKPTNRKPAGPLPMLSRDEDDPDDAAFKCADFVRPLRPFLGQQGHNSQLSTCSLDKFKEIVSYLTLPENMVVKSNVSQCMSLAIHPNEDKVLIASGSKRGNLGLWDMYNTNKEKCVEVLEPHTRPINCTSFDQFDPTKVITTSYDGTVRRGDLMKLVFEELWAHDQNGCYTFAFWHEQADPHCMMVSHGTGHVVVVDTRKPKTPVGWFRCHERDARTIHKHPMDNKHFVTSSLLGQVRVWDWRMINQEKPKPLWNLEHPKGLTSTFFSCKGSFLLTTCNDDRLRVFKTAHLRRTYKPKVVTNIIHNKCSGGNPVFKAMWHPQREDVFMVGSMDRQLQIYGIHGLPVHNLTSDHFLSVPSVHAWHPTLPIIAAASGAHAHVFI